MYMMMKAGTLGNDEHERKFERFKQQDQGSPESNGRESRGLASTRRPQARRRDSEGGGKSEKPAAQIAASLESNHGDSPGRYCLGTARKQEENQQQRLQETQEVIVDSPQVLTKHLRTPG